jgi:DNA polymerase III delta subunit
MILFLFGEDSFSSWQKLNLIKDKFLASQDSQNLIEYTANQLEGIDLDSIFNVQSLWAGHRLIIFRDVLAEAKAELKDRLKVLLSADYGTELTIIIWESSTFDKRQALYKMLNVPKRAEEFTAVQPARMPARLTAMASERNLQLSPAELKQLVQTVGMDLWLAHSELSKLAFCPPELRSELISATTQSGAFALQDAIVSRQPETAWHVLRNQLLRGDDSALLLGSLAATLRNLVRINALAAGGKSPSQIASATAIHPFVVSKLISLANSHPQNFWASQYRRLSDLDWKIKTGALEAEGALELAVVGIA